MFLIRADSRIASFLTVRKPVLERSEGSAFAALKDRLRVRESAQANFALFEPRLQPPGQSRKDSIEQKEGYGKQMTKLLHYDRREVIL